MHTIRIPLKLTFVESNLSPAESHPQIKCYLDAHFDREAVTIQLDRVGATYNVEVSGSSSLGLNPQRALCFASMAWRPNASGSPCLQDTGVAHITFGEIAEGLSQGGSFEKDCPLLMHTAQGYNKGTVRIHIDKVIGVRFDNHLGVTIESSCVPLINGYINETLQEEQGMPETFQGTENMRIPFDYSEAGIQTTHGTPLPAVSFVLTETPKTNDGYWKNAYETIMARDGLAPEDWTRLNLAGQARATILMVAYAAHYFDYVSDTVDRNTRFAQYSARLVEGYENFGDALAMAGSGDCEDLGKVIKQAMNAFIGHTFPQDWSTHKRMQAIAREYLPILSLDVVRGAQVADQVEHYGAHMNDNFPSQYKFRQWLGRTREGRKFLQTLPSERKGEVSLTEAECEDLPFLVGEGTGMYEPYGYENPLLPLMAYVYRAPSLAGFKKPILHKKGEPGSFFVGSLVGLTDYYYRQGAHAPLGFWYCSKQGSKLSRGVSYADMMNDGENVAVKVQPLVPRSMMPTILEAISRRVPPDPLTLNPGTHAGRKRHSVLERVCKAVEGFQRAPGSIHNKVPVYIRPHQLDASAANAMIGDFSRLERVWKVAYHLEEITDKMWGYRMEIFVS